MASNDIFGFMRSKGKTVGDITSPIPVEWNAMNKKKRIP